MKQSYQINPETELIPNVGLGEFIEGYYSKGKSYNYWLLLLLAPWLLFLIYIWNNDEIWEILSIMFGCIGLAFFLFLNMAYFSLKRNLSEYYFLYSNGFMWQRQTLRGKVVEMSKIEYKNIKGIQTTATDYYKNGVYQATVVKFVVADFWGNQLFKQKNGYNKDPEKYNLYGYAYHAILDQWNNIALDRFNQEIADRGYGTFYSGKSIIQIGRDFMKVDNAYMELYNYSFNDGNLIVYQKTGDEGEFKIRNKPISIDVNNMLNNDVFLFVLNQLHGIK